MTKFCANCGAELERNAVFCGKCGKQQKEVSNANNNQNVIIDNNKQLKSKIAAGLFGIFLGAFGIHNFYLGYNGKAIAQLLITLLSCGFLSIVSGIWGLIEGILVLTGEINKDAEGNPLSE